MRFWKPVLISMIMTQAFVTAGCNSYRVIPPQLEKQVNTKLNYQAAKEKPGSAAGQMVVWGGEVLQATRQTNKTRVEVLQIPLTDDLIPTGERAESLGRFLAFDTKGEIIDPAVIPEGTRVTIVGELQAPGAASTDPGSSEYPIVNIRDMTVWDKKVSRAWPRPYYGPYYGSYYYGYRPYVFWDGARVEGS